MQIYKIHRDSICTNSITERLSTKPEDITLWWWMTGQIQPESLIRPLKSCTVGKCPFQNTTKMDRSHPKYHLYILWAKNMVEKATKNVDFTYLTVLFEGMHFGKGRGKL